MFAILAICCLLLGGTIDLGAHALPTPNAVSGNSSLAENYAALVRDVKWFFQRLANAATTMEAVLPNATSQEQQSALDSTRLHFLKGLRHMLAAVREISITIQQSFDTEHVRHLQQLKQAKAYVQHTVLLLKDWFAHLRSLLAELYRLYSYYAPEALLAKCLGQYAETTYPEREVYEYPLLLFNDVFERAWELLPNGEVATGGNATEEVRVEQNEIPHKDEAPTTAQPGDSTTDAVSDSAAGNETAKAWQKCFQLYTAETIMRQLKLYFIET